MTFTIPTMARLRTGLPGRFARDESGTAAIEFALVAMPLFLMTFALIQMGWVMLQSSMLTRGVDRVVREVRIDAAAYATTDEMRQAICDRAMRLVPCDDVSVELSILEEGDPAPVDPVQCRDRGSPDPAENAAIVPGARSDLVLMRVCAVVDPLVPGFGLAAKFPLDPTGGLRLVSATAYKIE